MKHLNLPIRISLTICLLGFLFEACENFSTAGEGELLSDGFISWNQNGIPFIVHDSITAGDPGENLLYSNLQDSVLSLTANLSFGEGRRAMFTIVHCHDTGTYTFSTNQADNEHSSAEVYDYLKQADYVTDSSLESEFHLTRLDTAHGRIAGTFAFTARRFNGVDTIRIGNGVVFDFPITAIKN